MTGAGNQRLPRGALDGVRVIDMTTVLFGPYGTQWLGDMGADVIKVEGLGGDSTRITGPCRNLGMASMFLGCNRNKRSLALDVKHPAGLEVIKALIREADVFVTNVRPLAVDRLGLGYAQLQQDSPRLVYCNAVGYGQTGPYAARPALDDTIQAMSGSAALQAEFAGEPQYVGSAVADKVSGLVLALALVAAVRHAERTGQGQQVEVPMYETMVAFNLVEHLYGSSFVPSMGEPRYPRVVSKFRRPYRTLDGYIAVVPYGDIHWKRFFDLVGQPDLMLQERFSTMDARTRNIDVLYGLLADQIASRTTAEWLDLLQSADIPAVQVRSLSQIVAGDAHLTATGFFEQVEHPTEGPIVHCAPPVRMSGSPLGLRRHAPALGQDSMEILTELGLSGSEIEGLRSQGVIT
ncbi:CaiB/BaiF CoA transferase family protein [Pseudorhodoferax soli]|uniref:Crotonobetainyl-CoA:carnitine CoA-transferase CaiB-like acyl-CoA transferase n=1 Tax=Pseudorhodoferax soli TaxID=545864 RepID=A0A368XM35_9BURK|nr:CoA transferase [Pseudorhodoferax soli]RCW68609.1 crotonobetainyl-CoA:carnitine CoA-transferase CaiB-like acyl-CoA transferase [Pseudorhodoferax soli]